MILLLQLYLPDSRHAYSYHRCIYVFACPRGACTGHPQSSVGLRAFRCCLPRANEWYAAEYDEHDRRDSPNAGESNVLCGVCGCLADPRLTSPSGAYCHAAHAALARQHGGDAAAAELVLFRECFVELEPQEEEEERGSDESSDEEGELSMEEVREQLRLVKRLDPDSVVDMRSCLSGHRQAGRDTAPRLEASLQQLSAAGRGGDLATRFMDYCKEEPQQVVRYARHGTPLYPAKRYKPGAALIRECACGTRREFEFQVLPQLLFFLKVDLVDGLSFDFATLLVYTCYCLPPSDYVEEQVFKQDFDDDQNLCPTKQIMKVLDELDQAS